MKQERFETCMTILRTVSTLSENKSMSGKDSWYKTAINLIANEVRQDILEEVRERMEKGMMGGD